MQDTPVLGTYYAEQYDIRQLQGKIDGERSPGRRCTSWLANLRARFDDEELFQSATNKTHISNDDRANIRNGSAAHQEDVARVISASSVLAPGVKVCQGNVSPRMS